MLTCVTAWFLVWAGQSSSSVQYFLTCRLGVPLAGCPVSSVQSCVLAGSACQDLTLTRGSPLGSHEFAIEKRLGLRMPPRESTSQSVLRARSLQEKTGRWTILDPKVGRG